MGEVASVSSRVAPHWGTQVEVKRVGSDSEFKVGSTSYCTEEEAAAQGLGPDATHIPTTPSRWVTGGQMRFGGAKTLVKVTRQ
jgi:hypothetical protein